MVDGMYYAPCRVGHMTTQSRGAHVCALLDIMQITLCKL
jgi:hypothetical protein